MDKPPTTEFERAGRERDRGLLGELWNFLRENKKFWLIPMIIVFVILGALVILGANPAVAPFIYTLF